MQHDTPPSLPIDPPVPLRTNGQHPLRSLREVPLDQLKPHPRNYQTHPDDEIEHLMQSIREHGIYRNVVVARDWTLLAGHGVVEAARRLHLDTIPVYLTGYDPFEPRALKLLAADNSISHLAMRDDRALTELLKELKDSDVGLLGTGYDEMMLANLLFVTRPASEIADLDAAAQWIGMPEYDEGDKERGRLHIIVKFIQEKDREEFCRRLGLDARLISTKGSGRIIWWPLQMNDDVQAVRFTDREKESVSDD